MSENNPRVSIVIPAYNMAEYTSRCVKSILNQTYKNIEIIVVDDGSKDNTKAEMLKFGDRIKYVCKENGGACSARNFGARLAQGKYIGFLDCDDMYLPQKVELSVKFLEQNPDYGFVYSNLYYVDKDDKIFRLHAPWFKRQYQGRIKTKLILGNFVGNPTVIMRKDCLDKVGLYREDIFFPADWDMWLRISEQFKAGYINKPLCSYRIVSQGCFKNLEKSEHENMIVLDSFFLRNKDVSNRIKNRAYANNYLSMAECYFVKENKDKARKELNKALSNDPLNLKVLSVFSLYFLFPAKLKRALQYLIEHK